MEHAIDRRNFLKGALATGALAAGGAALAGCSPAKPEEGGSASNTTDAGALPKGYECAEDW